MGLFRAKIPRNWLRYARNFHVCSDDPNKMDLCGRVRAQLQIFHIFGPQYTISYDV